MSPRRKYATVAEYLADVPAEQRRRLQQIRKLAQQLEPYRNAKGNLSFDLAEPLPVALLKRVIRALAAQRKS